MRKVSRILIRLLVLLMIALTLFALAGIFVMRKYGDEIKKYTVSQVNRQLETKIAVRNINLSFFSGFPFVSVVFNDVTAFSGHDLNIAEFPDARTDTLFNAEKIYLQFNVLDVIFGNYRIRRIHTANGSLNMLVDHEGRTNFRLLTEKSPGGGKSRGFELEAVKLNDINIRFVNLAKNITSHGYIDDILLRGKFAKNDFAVATLASFRITDFTREGVKYADHFDITARAMFRVRDSLATVTKGELEVNNLRMNINGNFTIGSVSDVDLSLQGRHFDLHSLLSALPDPQREKIPIDLYGKGDIAFKVRGKFSRLEVPSIHAVYLLDIQRLTYRKRGFRNLRLKGRFSNGSQRTPMTSSISVEEYSINDYATSVSGRFSMRNLKQPLIELTMGGDIASETINQFMNEDKISDFQGILHTDVNLKTRLKGWKIENTQRILSSGFRGKLDLDGFGFILNHRYPFSGINGTIVFSGNTFYPSLELTSGLSRMGVKLQLDNVFRFIMNREAVLWISGDVDADRFDLTPYIQPAKDEEKGIFRFPERVRAKLNVHIDTLTGGKFMAQNTRAFLQYQPGTVTATSIDMHSMAGSVKGEAAVIQDNEKNIFIQTRNNVRHLNIHEMFRSLNNFDQDFIVAQNLKGYLSGEISFATSFDSLLTMNKNKTSADAAITIASGELIDFEPIEKLSRFVALDELKHIRFSKLENHIIIKDQKVYIPKMDIQSSAFNITISGIHNFDNHFDYKLKISLSEILAGKARKAKAENSEFGRIAPDNRQMNLYLSLAGTPEDFKIKYDKKEALVNIKQDIQEEKGRLKSILNEEFGWFEEDTAEAQKEKNQEDQPFIIEWGEDKDSISSDTIKPGGASPKFKIEWDEDDR